MLHKSTKGVIAGAAIALAAAALTIPVANAASAATPATGFLQITQDDPKASYAAGDVLNFTVTVTNNTATLRAYKLGTSNLTGFENCQWSTLAANQSATCAVTHAVSAADITAGAFTPEAVLTQYATAGYTGTSVNFEQFQAPAVQLAAAVTPALAFFPASVPAGGTGNVAVSGFAPNEVVTITAPDGQTVELTTDSEGRASGNYTLSADTATGAALTFTATGKTSGKTVSSAVQVTAPALTPVMAVYPTTIAAGGSGVFAVSGFASNEVVTITAPDGQTADLTVDAQGRASGNFDVAAETAPGTTLTFTATGKTSGLTVTATAQVVAAPVMAVIPNPAAAGSTVNVAVNGFAAGETVTFTAPDGSTEALVADANGLATWQYTVPSDTEPGTVLEFSATGQTSNLTATASLEVAATETPEPTATSVPAATKTPAATTAVDAKDKLATTGAEGFVPLAALSGVLLAGSLVAFVLRRKQEI